jgi:hypothetical protein
LNGARERTPSSYGKEGQTVGGTTGETSHQFRIVGDPSVPDMLEQLDGSESDSPEGKVPDGYQWGNARRFGYED